MQVYLIRHGLAGQHGDYPNDNERPLTEDGKRKTHQVAKRLHDLGLRFDLSLTSPLVRAKQTAEILEKEKLSKTLEVVEYLAPGGKIQQWLEWLENWKAPDKTLALVGHEPDLSAWAELLIWGEVREKLILKKAGTIALLLPDNGSAIANSQLFWLVPPKCLL